MDSYNPMVSLYDYFNYGDIFIIINISLNLIGFIIYIGNFFSVIIISLKIYLYILWNIAKTNKGNK